jgi:outer membrane protein OmpA-like peptidoglycan-associated protein
MLKNHYIFSGYFNFSDMKLPIYSKLIVVALFLSLGVQLQAQKEMGISFKRLFLDYQSLNGGDFGAFQDLTNGFEAGVHFPLSEHFMINVPIKVGLSRKTEENTNENIYGIDAQLHWFFISHPNRFKPYLLVGGGAVEQDKVGFNFQAPAGIGLDVKLTPNAYFNIQGEYRYSSIEDNSNFHYGIGFKYYFVKQPADTIATILDMDGDGINDEFDACPTVPGLVAFNGCPDRDGDGVQDLQDECPDIAGLMELHGCPDSDGDAVADYLDLCPTVPGLASNNGCPADKDGDGILDNIDKCPDVPGVSKFLGCPDTDNDGVEDPIDKCPTIPGLVAFMGCPDTDKDGIADNEDHCPNTYGPVSNHGCPVLEAAEREVLTFAMKAVQFELGKATLKPESNSVLNQIANIMKKYPDYKISIEGHTDNTGSAEVNAKLSENRAKACYDYLASKGVPTSRMSYKGFGQSRPIADNGTYSGRTLNRRVEFNVTPIN